VLRVPAKGVRPSQDRLRESLFSSLGGTLEGWRVLDLYAGSGALGLEAWSRGAAEVRWIERDPRAFAVLRENVAALCGEETARRDCRRADAASPAALRAAADGRPFDLVLADPPYEATRAGRLVARTLQALADTGIVAADGLLAFEMSAGEAATGMAGWELLRDRAVGDSRWVLYRRRGGEGSEAPP
jgi:16S rRNA (guanine966-N2)-methyltransferase